MTLRGLSGFDDDDNISWRNETSLRWSYTFIYLFEEHLYKIYDFSLVLILDRDLVVFSLSIRVKLTICEMGMQE